MTNSILPLRIGVGAIVLNEYNRVLVGKRKDNPINKWQMPQGGVNKDEDLYSAMRRELYEA
jgi:putative (di)nucleoside polyphosphate hydrolase